VNRLGVKPRCFPWFSRTLPRYHSAGPPVAPDGGSELPDTVDVTATAAERADRYLNPTQLERVLRQETGYVCRKRPPNHEGLYPDDEFLIRGEFCGRSLDIAVVVEDDRIVVAQISQHADSLRGQFYCAVCVVVTTTRIHFLTLPVGQCMNELEECPEAYPQVQPFSCSRAR
jgi:hypothetical protein